uniref:Uncharacterized protein n=1 Tax=Podoviridae sp. ct8Lf7 TaxID=2827723 RepID=A0A8S5RZV2_9CAUD|nr:MAG TPA: hypothetical protein [Podoviridae sp. ct8Lf7]
MSKLECQLSEVSSFLFMFCIFKLFYSILICVLQRILIYLKSIK